MLVNFKRNKLLELSGFRQETLADGSVCSIWARGYFFDANDRMHLDGEIVDWLAGQLSSKPLADLVPGMNGCFSLVVVRGDPPAVDIGIDRFGTIPVYYHIGDGQLVLSDDYWQVVNYLPATEYDAIAVVSMVLLGYVSGYRTLLRGIKELEQASIHRFCIADATARLDTQRYWRMHYQEDHQPRSWRTQLAGTLDSVFSRSAQAARQRGWEVCVPLSGGKDSRLIAAMYQKQGASVRAFSYGPSGDPETRIATKVAAVLGIPLRVNAIDNPSVLTRDLTYLLTRRVGMSTRFTAGLGAQLSLRTCSASDLYVPGHTGDLVSGAQIRRGALAVACEEDAVRHLTDVQVLPWLNDASRLVFGGFWDADLREEAIADSLKFDSRDPVGSVDRWDCENRQRRLILTELRTYERYGRWMLPFYDYELFDFFAAVPLSLRYQQRLYVDTLLGEIFTGKLTPLATIPLAQHGALAPAAAAGRDRLLMINPSLAISRWILRRASVSKHKEHRRSVGRCSAEPTGPDPIDCWWYDHPAFRARVLRCFQTWDGMGGLIDTSGLLRVLDRPQPRLFLQFVLPSLVTLRAFQALVESP